MPVSVATVKNSVSHLSILFTNFSKMLLIVANTFRTIYFVGIEVDIFGWGKKKDIFIRYTETFLRGNGGLCQNRGG